MLATTISNTGDSRAAAAHLLCRRLIGATSTEAALMLASSDRRNRSREELVGDAMLVIRPSAPARNVHERVDSSRHGSVRGHRQVPSGAVQHL